VNNTGDVQEWSAPVGAGRLRPFVMALFWCMLVSTTILALLPNPPSTLRQVPDKLQHFLAFAVLAALGVAAHSRTRLVRLSTLLVLYGGAIELLQMLVPRRQGSLFDWFIDVLAVALVLCGAFPLRRRKPR
jgi:VanZ family protein